MLSWLCRTVIFLANQRCPLLVGAAFFLALISCVQAALPNASAPAASAAAVAATPLAPLQELLPAPLVIASTLGAPSAVSGKADAQPVDWWARVVGALGFVIAVGNFLFGMHKVRRDRRLSIEDDFWFRKIITPTAIEPMLRAFVDLLDDLPGENTKEDERRTFSVKVTKDVQRLQSSAQALALLHESLPGKVSDHLRACEDLLVEFAGTPIGIALPDHAAVRAQVWQSVNAVMRLLQEAQLNK